MKVTLKSATIATIACALPLLTISTHAQASGGAGAGAGAGASGASGASGISSSAVITGGGARGSVVGGSAIGTSGAVSPTGNLGANANSRVGTDLSTPAGAEPARNTVTPRGPINPGGISATPPANVGRTFDRTTIGGAPRDSVIDPVGNQPVFRFPPGSTPAQDIVTNTPTIGAAGATGTTFPGAPVAVGNTVGANFPRGVITSVPREPVAVNLPPGARVVTNPSGVSVATVPGPVIVPTNSVGRGPAFESASERGREVPQTSPPPRNPSLVRP